MRQQRLWAFFARKCPQTIALLLAVVFVNNAAAKETISVDAPRLQPGASGRIAILLENTTKITAFQFDITLSEGLSIVQSEGKYGITLTSRASSTHQISVSAKENGTLRIAAYSMNNTAFADASGALLLIDVNVADDCEEEQSIMLSNIRLTTKNVTELKLDNVTTAIPIGCLIGDVNNDGKVDVSDYIGIANHILGSVQQGFNIKAADVNGDGNIDVSDYIGVANIILTGSIYGNQQQSRISLKGGIE